jgi:hypothetical protein
VSLVSSVLERVQSVLVAFGDVRSRPTWSAGRRRVIGELPINCRSLGLTEAEVFETASWPDPKTTAYGLDVRWRIGAMTGFSEGRYRRNFQDLVTQLRHELRSASVVFTHGPWGEYGHEEHVQVFRAVDLLRREFGFQMMFPGYVSEKSIGIAARYAFASPRPALTLPTNSELAEKMRSIYMRHDCWTWFQEYQWPEVETFFEWKGRPDSEAGGGVGLMNLIRLNWTRPSRRVRVKSALLRVIKGLNLP